jgi:hypothetical protein
MESFMEIRKTDTPITQTHTFGPKPAEPAGESKTMQIHIAFMKEPKKTNASLTPPSTQEVSKASQVFARSKL